MKSYAPTFVIVVYCWGSATVNAIHAGPDLATIILTVSGAIAAASKAVKEYYEFRQEKLDSSDGS